MKNKKTGNFKIFILGGVSFLAIMFLIRSLLPNLSNKESTVKESIDKFLDNRVKYAELVEDVKEEARNELTENEIITNQMLESYSKADNDELIALFAQAEVQMDEYTKMLDKTRRKEGLKNINSLCIEFVVKNQELRGNYYQDLDYEAKEKILEYSSSILEMYKTGLSKDEIKRAKIEGEYKYIIGNIVDNFYNYDTEDTLSLELK